MIQTYLKNPLGFVCPKRKRGLTDSKDPGIWDPSITGFLSYGFNEIGCFCLADPANGMTTPTPPFKATLAKQPANLVCVTEVSGSNNPGDCDGNPGPGSGNADTLCGDAAWLDDVWESTTGPNQPVDSENARLQTAWGKHNNRVNVLWVDGHATVSLASKLMWGQFWGVYAPHRPGRLCLSRGTLRLASPLTIRRSGPICRSNARCPASYLQRRNFSQQEKRLVCCARFRQIHLELRDPIVVLLGVNQHLLHAPGFFVLRRHDVSVTRIARVRVKANSLVFGVIGVQRLGEAFGVSKAGRRCSGEARCASACSKSRSPIRAGN